MKTNMQILAELSRQYAIAMIEAKAEHDLAEMCGDWESADGADGYVSGIAHAFHIVGADMGISNGDLVNLLSDALDSPALRSYEIMRRADLGLDDEARE